VILIHSGVRMRNSSLLSAFVATLSFASVSCTSDPAFWSGVAAGMAQSSAPTYTQGQSIFPSSPQLLLFGGESHNVFLGCLNCSNYDSGSVFNQYGTHGSRYSAESIFNRYGEYGSKYSNVSPCNPYASSPPAIVDPLGGFYGHLTVNRYNSQVQNGAIIAWLTGVCSDR
jgi:hypothetical protein